MRLILTAVVLLTSLYSFSLANEPATDSLRKIRREQRQKDTLAWVSHDDKIIVGSEISQLKVKLDIDNVFTNATDSNIFRFRGLDSWKFKTTHNSSAISYYLASRFGKIYFFSHKIPGTSVSGSFLTQYQFIGYGYMYKKLVLNASYKHVHGFIRSNEYDHIQDTLTNMHYRDFRFSVEFTSAQTSKFNKYGYSQLYVPVKATGFLNFKLESAFMRMIDKNGMIPFVTGYNWTPQGGYTINYDNEGYMQKLDIYVQSLFLHMGGVIPLLKKKGERAKSLAFKLDLHEGLDAFWYSVSPGANGVEKSGMKFRALMNFYGSTGLMYSDRYFIAGANISYKANFFSSDSELSLNNSFRTIMAYLAFRIPFKKGYEKINAKKRKVFGKNDG